MAILKVKSTVLHMQNRQSQIGMKRNLNIQQR